VKTITNKSHKPLKVPLPGGKFLHLGPLKSGQIADGAVDAPALKRLVKSGEIEIAGEGTETAGAGAHEKSASGKTARSGHAPTKVVRPQGDR